MKPACAHLILMIAVLGLSACGFRLAGTADLPPRLASMYIQATDFSETQRKALRRTLRDAGAQLVNEPGESSARLSVRLLETGDQQIVSSANNGDIVTRISRSLDFNVKAADGTLIAAPRSLRQQKEITLDNNNLLASNRERAAVLLELEQALYDQLVRQLSRF